MGKGSAVKIYFYQSHGSYQRKFLNRSNLPLVDLPPHYYRRGIWIWEWKRNTHNSHHRSRPPCFFAPCCERSQTSGCPTTFLEWTLTVGVLEKPNGNRGKLGFNHHKWSKNKQARFSNLFKLIGPGNSCWRPFLGWWFSRLKTQGSKNHKLNHHLVSMFVLVRFLLVCLGSYNLHGG